MDFRGTEKLHPSIYLGMTADKTSKLRREPTPKFGPKLSEKPGANATRQKRMGEGDDNDDTYSNYCGTMPLQKWIGLEIHRQSIICLLYSDKYRM